MKPIALQQIANLLSGIRIQTIGEIGTHHGKTASQLCNLILGRSSHSLHYEGFDLFDLATNETHNEEINGKGSGDIVRAKTLLNKISKRYNPRLTYTLHKGFTTNTLVTPRTYDLVLIDGGHSYETVKYDYDMVKDSKVIIFDDYDLPDVERVVNEEVYPYYKNNIEIVDIETKKLLVLRKD